MLEENIADQCSYSAAHDIIAQLASLGDIDKVCGLYYGCF